MPDGPRYDDDFYAWTQYQAQVLRNLRTDDNRFDRERLAEEIEDLGKSERDTVRSQIRRILMHLLKLQHSPSSGPRYGWMGSILNARAIIDDKLTPTLRRDIEALLPRLYGKARGEAQLSFREFGGSEAADALPRECPYSLDQILQDDWFPDQTLEQT